MRKPDEIRSNDHNARFHAMCRDVAKKVVWADHKWSEEAWKRIFLGAKFGQAVVPCPFGGPPIVVNKRRSSKLTNEHMSELLGEMEAFGSEHGVEWSEDARG